MTWFKVDDKLHDHRKVRKAGKAAMGVWVLAGSWSMDNDMDGFIPDDVLLRWGNHKDAAALVSAGMWSREEYLGEMGHRFHDWSKFQPSAAVTAAKKAAEAQAGVRGNHKRWHIDRQISDPDCPLCYRVPDGPPDQEPDQEPDRGTRIASESAPIPPVPVPDPTTTPDGVVGASAPRPEVDAICEYLADAIAENGSKRPTITKHWQDEARRMIDIDKRTKDEVLKAIDWCQRGETDKARFWRSNILSTTKLRSKFDQMRLQAAEESRRNQAPQTNMQAHLALVREMAAEEHGLPFGQIGGAS